MTSLPDSSHSENLSTSERLAEIAERIAETVAGPAAYDVDLHARFPAEALEALKQERVLSALVPVEQGGMGATVTDISNAIRVVGRSCAAAGSVLAMHMEQMFVLLKFGTTPSLRRVIEEVVDKQLLIANANSEVGIGGDVMRSIAALEPEGDGWRFDKQALAASYGREADMILSTSRRTPDAADTDQALCLLRTADFTLEPTSGWDTLGLRGTCSSGLHITGHVTADDLFPAPFSEIANGGGGQLRHVLLTAVWTGLAEAAMEEAHKVVRTAARRSIGTTPQSALRLAEIFAEVQVAAQHVGGGAAADRGRDRIGHPRAHRSHHEPAQREGRDFHGRHAFCDCCVADLWHQRFPPRPGAPARANRPRRLRCADHGQQ